jgi:glycosyltransferase involved in cell wall biosynthesis
VRFVGAVGEADLIDLYARCRAVFFAPYNEDYGFVTVEAFESRKAVVTCTDSGGVPELVQHRVNGYVLAPDPAELGQALAELAADARLAEKLGDAAHGTAAKLTWERTVAELTRP